MFLDSLGWSSFTVKKKFIQAQRILLAEVLDAESLDDIK